MVRVFCIVSLALAAVSAVSGHVIRRQHKKPSGWETDILQNYDQYHERYLQWGCDKKHNTTFFDNCCHPLLKGESMSVLDNLKCNEGCDDGDASVPPPSTPSSPSQLAPAYTSPSATPSPPSKPATGALGKANDSPSPSPSSSSTTPAYTPPKSSASPPPAKTSDSGSHHGGDVHTGGQVTFYTQNGNAGACGTKHGDNEFICAIDSALYSQSVCGKKVHITNMDNGNTVDVIAADECPTCANANSIDLSVAAFKVLGNTEQGVLRNIKWEFV